MANHPRRNRRLPYGVFEDGERTAVFADFDQACLFALGRSRGGHLVDVVNKTGIVDQYQDGRAVPDQPGVAHKYVDIRHTSLYQALEAAEPVLGGLAFEARRHPAARVHKVLPVVRDALAKAKA